MTPATRLDQALVDLGLVSTRSLARRLILAGEVTVDGQKASKPGTPVAATAQLAVAERPRFVSRGGNKLVEALERSGLDLAGAECLDIGASTGGFTDCLLQHGAQRVIAVDVGYGQLDWKLRNDPRVVVLERTNARHLEPQQLPEGAAPSIVTMDVSFIGILKILPALGALCAPAASALVLVKPQFEAGPDQVESGGVVRSASTRRATVEAVALGAEKLGWGVRAAYPSPLRGPAGNWECFLFLERPASDSAAAEVIARLDIPDGP